MTAESRLTLLFNICVVCPFLFNPISWGVIAKLANKSVYTVKRTQWQMHQPEWAALWKLFIFSLQRRWWIASVLGCFFFTMLYCVCIAIPQSICVAAHWLMVCYSDGAKWSCAGKRWQNCVCRKYWYYSKKCTDASLSTDSVTDWQVAAFECLYASSHAFKVM